MDRAANASSSTTVLGVDVDADLVERWRGWFAPPVQPFRVDLLPPDVVVTLPQREVEPTPEWTDTFFLYTGTWAWLDEQEFRLLTPAHRRSLMAVRRRSVRPKTSPVWPSELARSGDQVMLRWMASGVERPSRHREVPRPVWQVAQSVLPDVERLAGTFAATGSGPNCFSAVMAAAGVDVGGQQVAPDTFARWLDGTSEPISGTGHDGEPGVVFTWTEHGKLAHATVTVGAGWMFGKGSQSWSSPRFIRPVREVVASWRYPGTSLSRHRIRR